MSRDKPFIEDFFMVISLLKNEVISELSGKVVSSGKKEYFLESYSEDITQ